MKQNGKGGKFRKQLVSGGIYIALAAAVVTVTLNGVNSIIGTETDVEIPNIDTEIPEIKLELPEMNLEDIIFDDEDANGGSDSQKEFFSEKDKNVTVSDSPLGVSDTVIVEKSENNSVKEDKTDTADEKADDKTKEQETEGKDNTVNESGIEYPTEPEPVFYGVFAKPADGYIDKEFTTDTLVYSPSMGDFRTHNGIDITGELASPVRAVCDGVVEDVYFDNFYGYTVAINHGNGITALYMNLSEEIPQDIRKGESVKIGQVIGGIGQSAAAESAEVSHLHLSIKRNGEFIDPCEFLRQ